MCSEQSGDLENVRSSIWNGVLVGLGSLFLVVMMSWGASYSWGKTFTGVLEILAGLGMLGFAASVFLFYQGFLKAGSYRIAGIASLITMSGSVLYALYFIVYGAGIMGDSSGTIKVSMLLYGISLALLAVGAPGVGMTLRRLAPSLGLGEEAGFAGIFYSLLALGMLGLILGLAAMALLFYSFKPELPSPEAVLKLPSAPPPRSEEK